MALFARVVEFGYVLSGPVVSYGPCPPVEYHGRGGDGEEVLTRVTNLQSTAVLEEANREVFCVVCVWVDSDIPCITDLVRNYHNPRLSWKACVCCYSINHSPSHSWSTEHRASCYSYPNRH